MSQEKYKLKLRKEKLDPSTVPADASSTKYTVVELLKKNKDYDVSN